MKAIRWTDEQLAQHLGKPKVQPMPKKPSKYKNVKCELDGMKFDSKKEMSRYAELKRMEASGTISHLRMQTRYILAESVVVQGRKRPALLYIADFEYFDKDKKLVVNDCKGMRTTAYNIKRHLMMSVLGIEILET